MAVIAIYDSESSHLEVLSTNLRQRGHVVVPLQEASLDELGHQALQTDILIVNFPKSNETMWDLLRHFCGLRRETGVPLPVLCCSKVYRGPRFELDIERLGARLAYEE